ncbi:hypothetical protein AAIH32_12585 [Pseudarthrobacter oxydans]|uniref:hypothetical protein n=1 Tax=Pseudarthrobacter oxydans TaxID=1671 RepID=UPI003D28EFBA
MSNLHGSVTIVVASLMANCSLNLVVAAGFLTSSDPILPTAPSLTVKIGAATLRSPGF